MKSFTLADSNPVLFGNQWIAQLAAERDRADRAEASLLKIEADGDAAMLRAQATAEALLALAQDVAAEVIGAAQVRSGSVVSLAQETAQNLRLVSDDVTTERSLASAAIAAATLQDARVTAAEQLGLSQHADAEILLLARKSARVALAAAQERTAQAG